MKETAKRICEKLSEPSVKILKLYIPIICTLLTYGTVLITVYGFTASEKLCSVAYDCFAALKSCVGLGAISLAISMYVFK